MESYINAACGHANNVLSSFDQNVIYQLNLKYYQWTQESNKHLVTEFFSYKLNGAYYTLKQYEERVRSFYEVLIQTERDYRVQEIMKKCGSVVSFGCGPGPEIAAYICYVRNRLHCDTVDLDILGVDCLRYWEGYINAIDYLDTNHFTDIKFQNALLNCDYLQYMEPVDVCIMSYPHAMNFPNIWGHLKEKFSAIICLEQAKEPLLNLVSSYDYEIVDFFYNGNKTMFYFIGDDDNNSDMDDYPSVRGYSFEIESDDDLYW